MYRVFRIYELIFVRVERGLKVHGQIGLPPIIQKRVKLELHEKFMLINGNVCKFITKVFSLVVIFFVLSPIV